MGRNQDGDEQPTSQMLYPCMQCADIFFLKADVCQLGKDQRKVNALALEYCNKLHKTEKPVIVSHHMLMGLKQGQEKMSKSDPNSAIFMEDSREAVKKKIRMGYCAEKEIEKNPILDYCRYIIFPACGSLTIVRKPENGGE
jgi:tyrosyl-tRNA synthetase